MLLLTMEQRPRLNTLEKDIEDFQAERKKFLDAQDKFRAGYATYGIVALNNLMSMYHILLASYHYIKPSPKMKPEEFQAEVKKAKSNIAHFVKVNQDDMPGDGIGVNFFKHQGFIAIENEYEKIVEDFYKIKADCGLT